jgi:hypothetical protein
MKMINKLKRLFVFIRTFFGYHLFKATKKKVLKKICVVSSPRGGSTWLGEVLSEGSNSLFIDEPLFVNSHKRLKEVGISWEIHLNAHNNEDQFTYFFNDLFSLRFFHWRPLVKNRISKFIGTDRLVFKFINANLLLDYFGASLKSEKLIYMIRNPYAVVSSQLNHNGWLWAQKVTTMKIPESMLDLKCFKNLDFKELKNLTAEQVLTFNWCLTNKPVISSLNNNKKWLTVTYENLIDKDSSDLSRIREYIDEGKDLNTQLISSSTKGNAANDIKLGNQLNKWKSKLTSQQVENIHEILYRFNFVVYDVNTGLPEIDSVYNK